VFSVRGLPGLMLLVSVAIVSDWDRNVNVAVLRLESQ